MVCCEKNTHSYQPLQRPAQTDSRSSLLPQPGECGIQGSDRIYGGGLTYVDEFPWAALLEYRAKRSSQTTYACGGSLISSRYVITAAHCINVGDWELFSVRLGEWDLESDVDCYQDDCADPPIDVPVEQKIRHEGYDPKDGNTANDIALLRLAQPVKSTYFVKPICLPTEPKLSARNKDYTGQSFDVTGWGKTEWGIKSRYKLAVSVPVVNKAQCNRAYEPNRLTITDKQICAGGGDTKDSCNGDSGGPLMARDKTSKGVSYMYILGIVSYGPEKCATEGVPGVYTRVSEYIDWIKRNMRA